MKKAFIKYDRPSLLNIHSELLERWETEVENKYSSLIVQPKYLSYLHLNKSIHNLDIACCIM